MAAVVLVGVGVVAARPSLLTGRSDEPPGRSAVATPTPTASSRTSPLPVPDQPFTPQVVTIGAQSRAIVIGTSCRAGLCVVSSQTSGSGDGGGSELGTYDPRSRLGRPVATPFVAAVGSEGSGVSAGPAGLFRTLDSGVTWERLQLPSALTVVDVALGPDGAWLLVEECGDQYGCTPALWRTDLGTGQPARLARQPPLASGPVRRLVRPDARVAYVLGAGLTAGYITVTRDGGGTWSRISSPCPEQPSWDLAAPTASDVWLTCAATTRRDAVDPDVRVPVVFVSRDGGESWDGRGRRPPGPNALRLTAVSPTEAYRRGTAGELFRSTDSGRSWTRVPVPVRNVARPAVDGSTVVTAGLEASGTAVELRLQGGRLTRSTLER